MTAMREARGDSASADPINGTRGKTTINDRKFAFLNQITRPDYRSLPNSTATSQSSVPSTPITIPLKMDGGEQTMFREFGAPIATPEDELLDDLEIKSEPLLSPRRTFTDFEDNRRDSEEKENREEDTEAETTIREDIEDVEMVVETRDQSKVIEDQDQKIEENTTEEQKKPEVQKVFSNVLRNDDCIRMVESAPELTNSFQEEESTTSSSEFRTHEKSSSPEARRMSPSPEQEEIEAEEIRKMTESFGEPRKAVLERVYDTVEETDDDETETETENEEEEMDDDVQRQIDAVSRPDDSMVFGWNGKSKEKMEKPTSLPLRYEIEADCSTPRRAEFCIDPEDDENTGEHPQSTASGDEGVLQQSLIQLQKQLRKTDVRCSRLEKICEFQQRDIDSLRYEVDWKDKRIEYLQKTLQEMEASQSTSSRSTPAS
ncbi:unnamed protein product [Caenorhabditis sp. 36 PRJEB53466]|nr:unnamed protein product [Caenorhabditis sp. 36 PRJEB53466]